MKKLVLAVLVSGFAALSAQAMETDFTKVDADSDGVVTIEEAAAAGWEWTDDQFEAADIDESGDLDQEEFDAAVAS